jgi:DNA repair/transcription protein MET18/MMS19
MYTNSSDKDLFINLILLDEDIVNKIRSVSSVEKSILSSLEDLAQLHALGSVISILAESSTYFCTRVLQEHFVHLVDIVGTKADYESWQLNNSNGSSSAPINYGALYLSVQLLSSCREVALVSYKDCSSDKLAKESWWLILEKRLEQLIHLLQSFFTVTSRSMQPMFRQEYVSCAGKLTS